jgi:rRNA small subunit pseudouridine methyltransferase Nep1
MGCSLLEFILAEAALETVPEKLWRHPSVRRHAKRQNKSPRQLLLDRSFHHKAMIKLKNNLKRGRPDITHFVLLQALGSPLNRQGLLQVHVHTNQDYVITVNPSTKLPRNYSRFIGLIEQLFEQGKVPAVGEALLTMEKKTLKQLIAETKPDHTLAFSTEGKPQTLQQAIFSFSQVQNPAVIVGGFARGHFKETTSQLFDELVCVDFEMLEAWTITSRIIYEYERFLSLPKKRLKNSDTKF